MSKEQIEKERWDIAKIMADNFHINGEGLDESDFEWTAHCLQMAGYHRQIEWISVDERLPEESACYLVNIINHFGLDCVTFTYYTKNYGWGVPDVTHWMPLPEPPNMKGGAE